MDVRFRVFAIMDEYTRECLAILVARKIKADDVLCVLEELFVLRGTPVHVRSDNGPEFTANEVLAWLPRVDVQPLVYYAWQPVGKWIHRKF